MCVSIDDDDEEDVENEEICADYAILHSMFYGLIIVFKLNTIH